MNNLLEMIEGFQPETFKCVHTEIPALVSTFGLSASEADLVKVLLREYKAGRNHFSAKSVRHHVYQARRKLFRLLGSTCIVSLGMGYYSIPDGDKGKIERAIEGL